MSSESAHPLYITQAGCPHCGSTQPPVGGHCSACGELLRPPGVPTSYLSRPPQQWPIENQGSTRLLPGHQVILQVLPSGACLTIPPGSKAILGRGPALENEPLVDLSGQNGYQRGVSRRHCLLLRHSAHLYAIDLGSSNGSYLNGEPMTPYRRYTVADGDRLVLGSMHLIVSFAAPPAP